MKKTLAKILILGIVGLFSFSMPVLGSAFNSAESDPIFTASDSYGITSSDISNWDTAYGWDDHSTQNYLDKDTDPYVASESDPVFVASDVAGVTTTDISNWDTAYGWGDHLSAGYFVKASDTLDDISDGITYGKPTLTQISNWDTAYGWGDHAGENYLDKDTDPYVASESDPVFVAEITFAAIQTRIADKTLVNEEDAVTWDSDHRFGSQHTIVGSGSISSWDSDIDSMEVGLTGAFVGSESQLKMGIFNNAYVNGGASYASNAKYKTNGFAEAWFFSTDGKHYFAVADSGIATNAITWRYALILENDGDAIILGEAEITDTNTGGNAGTDLCIDANKRICACGSCA